MQNDFGIRGWKGRSAHVSSLDQPNQFPNSIRPVENRPSAKNLSATNVIPDKTSLIIPYFAASWGYNGRRGSSGGLSYHLS